jgi:hypothetical protein
MKTYNYTLGIILLTIVSIGSLSTISGCKRDDDPSATQVALKKLTTGMWQINQVTVDGVDQSSLFTGMTLQFSSTTYSTTNGGPMWAASGTWTFSDKTGKLITRDDGLQLTITSLTKSELIFTIPWDETTYGGGRKRSIEGTHTFKFTK